MTNATASAPNDTAITDPLEFVRARLNETTQAEWMRYAVGANISMRTLANIRNGHDARYNNVIALRDAIQKADATPAS